MLPTREELAENYSKFNNDRLLKILYKKNLYRPEAVDAAKEELKKRNIDLSEINQFVNAEKEIKARKNKIRKDEHIIQDDPIPFWEKLLYFILGALIEPADYAFNRSKKRSQTGARQRRLFSISGVVSTFLTVFLTLNSSLGNNWYFVTILMTFFCITYFVEKKIGPP
jgi:hypothetical protein